MAEVEAVHQRTRREILTDKVAALTGIAVGAALRPYLRLLESIAGRQEIEIIGEENLRGLNSALFLGTSNHTASPEDWARRGLFPTPLDAFVMKSLVRHTTGQYLRVVAQFDPLLQDKRQTTSQFMMTLRREAFKAAGYIPLNKHPEDGKEGVELLRARRDAKKAVAKGQPLFIFAEEVHQEPNALNDPQAEGAAAFARFGNVPVLPMYLIGVDRWFMPGWWKLWKKTPSKLKLVIGEAFTPTKGKADEEIVTSLRSLQTVARGEAPRADVA